MIVLLFGETALVHDGINDLDEGVRAICAAWRLFRQQQASGGVTPVQKFTEWLSKEYGFRTAPWVQINIRDLMSSAANAAEEESRNEDDGTASG